MSLLTCCYLEKKAASGLWFVRSSDRIEQFGTKNENHDNLRKEKAKCSKGIWGFCNLFLAYLFTVDPIGEF